MPLSSFTRKQPCESTSIEGFFCGNLDHLFNSDQFQWKSLIKQWMLLGFMGGGLWSSMLRRIGLFVWEMAIVTRLVARLEFNSTTEMFPSRPRDDVYFIGYNQEWNAWGRHWVAVRRVAHSCHSENALKNCFLQVLSWNHDSNDKNDLRNAVNVRHGGNGVQ